MKKLILVFAAVLFSFGMQAQDGKMPVKDHLMMQDGKMWVMTKGKTTAMTQDMKLSDGSTVSVAGKVTMADGNTKILSEGDSIDLDGMVTPNGCEQKRQKSENELSTSSSIFYFTGPANAGLFFCY